MKTKTIIKKLATATATLALLLTLLPAQPAQAAFPGLNGKLAFHAFSSGVNQVFSASLVGGDAVQLTDESTSNLFPRWSPDGTQIIFRSSRDGNQEIYLMDRNGSNQINVSLDSSSDDRPDWSPDGTKIVFATNRDGNSEIYVMNSDGSNPTRLTNSSGIDHTPSFSPDGAQIAFRSDRDGNSEIYVMNSDGSNPTRLTNHSSFDSDPDFSPDGSKIVFHRGTNPADIFMINADGTNEINLTNSTYNDQLPKWSPDGSFIIFRSDQSGANQAHKIMPDGSGNTQLTTQAQGSSAPSIQPLTIPPTTLNPNIVLNVSGGEAATYNTVSNHTDTYEAIDPTSVTITTQPQKGSLAVNESTGDITYTKNQQAKTGFNLLASLDNLFFRSVSAQAANQDSFSYQICSTANNELCTVNTVTVNLASTASLASTGDNSYNPVLISALLSLAGSTIWLIRRKYFSFV